MRPRHRVVPRSDLYFPRNTATTGWLIALNEGHSAGIDRWHPIDLELMLLVRLPSAMHLLPLARPMQGLDEHHGIVMNWTRWRFEQSYLKWLQ
jgi:hypothetical protein